MLELQDRFYFFIDIFLTEGKVRVDYKQIFFEFFQVYCSFIFIGFCLDCEKAVR